jgi:N-acetylglucosamine-6-phosphate deacetylase
VSPELVITGAAMPTQAGTMVDITLHGSRIADVTPSGGETHRGPTLDARGAVVTPGLVDLHLHGGFGISFDDCDAAAFAALTTRLAQRGITTIQASLVSQPTDRLADRLDTMADWLGPRDGRTTAVGVHLEGPFLATAQAGAHDPMALRSPTTEDLRLVSESRRAISMITVAPELPAMAELIHQCRTAGIGVAIGHSDGDLDAFTAARDAGAAHVTHLWSGQSMVRRRGPWRVPGMLESALASDLTAEIIADGKHLPPTLLEIARRCLDRRLVVVSDATPGAGMPDGYRYRLATVDCVVADGVGMVVGQDAFGGSTTLLDDMLRYLVVDLGWPLHEVLPMVTSTPAAVLGRSDLGRIVPGGQADLVLWEPDLSIRQVIISGQPLG